MYKVIFVVEVILDIDVWALGVKITQMLNVLAYV